MTAQTEDIHWFKKLKHINQNHSGVELEPFQHLSSLSMSCAIVNCSIAVSKQIRLDSRTIVQIPRVLSSSQRDE